MRYTVQLLFHSDNFLAIIAVRCKNKTEFLEIRFYITIMQGKYMLFKGATKKIKHSPLPLKNNVCKYLSARQKEKLGICCLI